MNMHLKANAIADACRAAQGRFRRLLVSIPAAACMAAAPASAPADIAPPSPSDNKAGLQTPIGTSIDLLGATKAFLAEFPRMAANGTPKQDISIPDLQRLLASSGRTLPDDVRDAAKFFIASPIARDFVRAGSGVRGPGGFMTKARLEGALKTLSSDHLETALLDAAAKPGKGSDAAYAAVLRDPGVPADIRGKIIEGLPDARLLEIVGQPNMLGGASDKAVETGAFLGLVRMSWLGAAEAEVLARYHVGLTLDRGPQDKKFSFWDGKALHVSEIMANTGNKPGYISEVLAHEGGHAIFQLSGLQAKLAHDAASAHLTPHIDGIMNEGFAGVFGTRAHVALFGRNTPNVKRHLLLVNDVGDSLANDNTFYAKYYHVDTAAARMQVSTINTLLDKDFVPFFQQNFNLLDDPYLTQGLAPQNQ